MGIQKISRNALSIKNIRKRGETYRSSKATRDVSRSKIYQSGNKLPHSKSTRPCRNPERCVLLLSLSCTVFPERHERCRDLKAVRGRTAFQNISKRCETHRIPDQSGEKLAVLRKLCIHVLFSISFTQLLQDILILLNWLLNKISRTNASSPTAPYPATFSSFHHGTKYMDSLFSSMSVECPERASLNKQQSPMTYNFIFSIMLTVWSKTPSM